MSSAAVRTRSPAPALGLLQAGARYLLKILLAFSLFGLILVLSGKDPLQSYKDILTSTLGSTYGLSEVIVAMIPMLITALAVALPSRLGLINVGGEGQLYIGAAFAAWGALTLPHWPAWALLPAMMLLGMLGGRSGPLRPATCARLGWPTRPSPRSC